jgi:tellurium resistance protein TerD
MVSLSKGGSVSLTKVASDSGVVLRESVVACGWDISNSDESYDLDLVAAALNVDGQLPEKGWFIYYNNKTAPQDVIRHSGDNLTGGGDGDDESIECNFPAIPAEIVRIVFAVNIYHAVTKG